jgi:predicted permease
MRDLVLRLRALTFRNRVEQELDEELSFHVEMQTRKNLAAGMDAAEAERQARIQFGVGDSAKEGCRDARRVNFFETLFQDIRYALRGFRKRPLFALTVTGTIAIGLGWNTAAFTIFNAYFLHPIDARDPYSLYAIDWQDRTGEGTPLTWRQLDELRNSHTGLAGISAMLSLRSRMNDRFATCTLVDGEYFHMLGVNAAIGRALSPEDARSPGSSPAVVLSYTTWQNRFNAAGDILGRKVLIHGHPFVIVGVMPQGFTGLGHSLPDLWASLARMADFEDIPPNAFAPDAPALVGIAGRLKPGESMEQARAALTAWMQRSAPAQMPRAILTSLATPLPLQPRYYAAFVPIGIVFLLVLLSACANVANMMLARAMSRQREIGIRLSLGAARGRLIRQLLTESVLLSIPAAAVGFGISQGFIRLGLRWLMTTIPSGFADYVRIAPLSPDIRVFWFMIGAAIVVALLFGLAPAVQATRLNVMQAARGDFSSEFRPVRLRNALVIAQVTVCGFLLIGSGVLLRSADRIASLDPGVRTRDLIELEVQEKSRARVFKTLRAQPTIEMLAATSDTPLDATLPDISASGEPAAGLVRIGYKYASPEYFQALEIPILKGRNFTPAEARAGAPAVILSESAAHRLWPNQDALGQTLHLMPTTGPVRGGRPPRSQPVQVVGIARDSSVRRIAEPDRSCLFFPTDLEDPRNVLLVRAHGDPETARRSLNAAIEESDAGAIEDVQTLQAELAASIWTYRVAFWISTVLGSIALLLTLSGIYAVLSYVVAQRTKEIGIRMAMGSSARAVTGLVLGQSLRLAGIGIAAGSALALAASRLLSALTAQVSIDVFDRAAYFGGIAVVLAACLAAAFFPARRAARIDPITTLRYD